MIYYAQRTHMLTQHTNQTQIYFLGRLLVTKIETLTPKNYGLKHRKEATKHFEIC